MTVKAILFDIDGTLVDSNDFHVLAWEEAFAGIGKAFDRQRIHDQIGKGTDMLVPTLLPGVDKTTEDRLGETQGAIFKSRFLDQVKPFDRAHDLLARVHAAGKRIIFASSASEAEAEHYIDLLGARGLVEAFTSADDVVKTKPAPDIFKAALAKIAPLGADEAIVVGDTPYDVTAAARSGMACVAVRSGKFPDQSLRGAIALYDDVAAVLDDFENSPLAR